MHVNDTLSLPNLQAVIAKFDVNRETIGNIKRRETWKPLA